VLPLSRKFETVFAALAAGLAVQVAASSSGRMKTDLLQGIPEVICPPRPGEWPHSHPE